MCFEPGSFECCVYNQQPTNPTCYAFNNSYGAQSKALVSKHMENGDAGCQIHEKETANWFVIKDLKFTCAD